MFLFAAPLSILASVLQDADPNNLVTFLQWTFASVIGYLAMLAVATFSRWIVNRPFDQDRLLAVTYLFFCFLTGATKGFITGYIGGELVNTSAFNNALIPRSITSGLIAVFIIPAGSLFLAGRERFNATRESLIKESIRIESQTQANTITTAQMQAGASVDPNSELGKEINDLLQDIAKLQKLPVESQWNLIAAELKRIVNEKIRPISQALWNDRQSQYPELTIREILNLVISEFIFPMWFVIGSSLIGATGQFLRHSEGKSLLQTLTWTTLSIALPYLVLEKLVKAKFIKGAYAFFILITVAIGFELIQLNWNLSGSNVLTIYFNAAIFGIFLIATLLTGGVIYAARQSQSQVIKNLSALVNQERIKLLSSEIQVEQTNREIAKFLHGHLQTRLMSMALALEISGQNSDFEKIRSKIDELELTLDNPLNRYAFPENQSLTDILNSIESSWSGLANFDISIMGDTKNLSENQLRNLETLVGESVTNAVRHGQASEITIQIKLNNERMIEVCVQDNGLGLSGNPDGLGTGLFTSICGDNWAIRNSVNKSGAVFSAQLLNLLD